MTVGAALMPTNAALTFTLQVVHRVGTLSIVDSLTVTKSGMPVL